MKLLAFETATEACSVAVWVDGEVCERFEIAPRRHAELALPWADEMLAQAGVARTALDAIAVGRGPGAFTGVRLAIALAQGVALALDRPIVPVSTLAALALQARAPRVLAAIDARMGEVYAAAFRCEGDNAFALDAERVACAGCGGACPMRRTIGSASARDSMPSMARCATRSKRASRGSTRSALPRAADVARLGGAGVQAWRRRSRRSARNRRICATTSR